MMRIASLLQHGCDGRCLWEEKLLKGRKRTACDPLHAPASTDASEKRSSSELRVGERASAPAASGGCAPTSSATGGGSDSALSRKRCTRTLHDMLSLARHVQRGTVCRVLGIHTHTMHTQNNPPACSTCMSQPCMPAPGLPHPPLSLLRVSSGRVSTAREKRH